MDPFPGANFIKIIKNKVEKINPDKDGQIQLNSLIQNTIQDFTNRLAKQEKAAADAKTAAEAAAAEQAAAEQAAEKERLRLEEEARVAAAEAEAEQLRLEEAARVATEEAEKERLRLQAEKMRADAEEERLAAENAAKFKALANELQNYKDSEMILFFNKIVPIMVPDSEAITESDADTMAKERQKADILNEKNKFYNFIKQIVLKEGQEGVNALNSIDAFLKSMYKLYDSDVADSISSILSSLIQYRDLVRDYKDKLGDTMKNKTVTVETLMFNVNIGLNDNTFQDLTLVKVENTGKGITPEGAETAKQSKALLIDFFKNVDYIEKIVSLIENPDSQVSSTIFSNDFFGQKSDLTPLLKNMDEGYILHEINIATKIRNLKENILGGCRVVVIYRDDTPDLNKTGNQILRKIGEDGSDDTNDPGNFKNKQIIYMPGDKCPDTCDTEKVKSNNQYLYGPFSQIYPMNKGEVDTSTFFTHSFVDDDLLSVIKNGRAVIIFGFGFSGSGKTFQLIDPNNKKSGKANNILSLVVKELEAGKGDAALVTSGNKVELTILEQYTTFDDIGNPTSELFYYKDTEVVSSSTTEIDKYIYQQVENPKTGNSCIWEEQFKGDMKLKTEGTESIPDQFNTINTKITQHRINQMRITSTPNNPESSRSHIFYSFKFNFNNKQSGTFIIVDMAGTENTIAIKQQFLGTSDLEPIVNIPQDSIKTIIDIKNPKTPLNKLKKKKWDLKDEDLNALTNTLPVPFNWLDTKTILEKKEYYTLGVRSAASVAENQNLIYKVPNNAKDKAWVGLITWLVDSNNITSWISHGYDKLLIGSIVILCDSGGKNVTHTPPHFKDGVLKHMGSKKIDMGEDKPQLIDPRGKGKTAPKGGTASITWTGIALRGPGKAYIVGYGEANNMLLSSVQEAYLHPLSVHSHEDRKVYMSTCDELLNILKNKDETKTEDEYKTKVENVVTNLMGKEEIVRDYHLFGVAKTTTAKTTTAKPTTMLGLIKPIWTCLCNINKILLNIDYDDIKTPNGDSESTKQLNTHGLITFSSYGVGDIEMTKIITSVCHFFKKLQKSSFTNNDSYEKYLKKNENLSKVKTIKNVSKKGPFGPSTTQEVDIKPGILDNYIKKLTGNTASLLYYLANDVYLSNVNLTEVLTNGEYLDGDKLEKFLNRLHVNNFCESDLDVDSYTFKIDDVISKKNGEQFYQNPIQLILVSLFKNFIIPKIVTNSLSRSRVSDKADFKLNITNADDSIAINYNPYLYLMRWMYSDFDYKTEGKVGQPAQSFSGKNTSAKRVNAMYQIYMRSIMLIIYSFMDTYMNILVSQGKGVVCTLEHLKFYFLNKSNGVKQTWSGTEKIPETLTQYDEKNQLRKLGSYNPKDNTDPNYSEDPWENTWKYNHFESNMNEQRERGYMDHVRTINILTKLSGGKENAELKTFDNKIGMNPYKQIILKSEATSAGHNKYVMMATLLRYKGVGDVNETKNNKNKYCDAALDTLDLADSLASEPKLRRDPAKYKELEGLITECGRNKSDFFYTAPTTATKGGYRTKKKRKGGYTLRNKTNKRNKKALF